MIIIELFISNGTTENHRFLIDNEPLDPQIDIANHVHQPFDVWKETIFDELSEICNDFFTVTAHCTIAQFDELKRISLHCSLCKECSHVSDNSLLGGAGAALFPTQEPVAVPVEIIHDFSFTQQQLEDLEKQGVAEPVNKLEFGFYISSDCEGLRNDLWKSFAAHEFDTRFLTRKVPFFNIVLQEIEDDEAEYFEHDYFAFAAEKTVGTRPVFTADDPAAFVGGILAFIRDKYLIPFISKYHANPAAMHDKVVTQEKNYSISLPQCLYVGDRVPLNVEGVCYGEVKGDLEFVCDKKDIVQFTDGSLVALSPGVANICFRIKGSLDNTVATGSISVSEHVYVRNITIPDRPDFLYVGESFYLNVNCIPVHAENAKDLRITSENRQVLTVSDIGRVVAERAGVGILNVEVGDVRKTVEISVKERLNRIVLPKSGVKGYLGTHIPFTISIEPCGYTEDDIMICSDDSSVASYENGEIIVNEIGSTDITFRSKTSNAQAVVHVEGQSTFMKKNYKDIPVQIGIVLFLLTVAAGFFGKNFFFVSIAGALLCIISLVLDKRSRLFSTIFALLNIAITYLLINGAG